MKTQRVADEIAACADMAHADGCAQIAKLLGDASTELGMDRPSRARRLLEIAEKGAAKFDTCHAAKDHVSLAVEVFEQAFGVQ